MIVGSYVTGDDDMALAWFQHSFYHEALRTLVLGAAQILRKARDNGALVEPPGLPLTFDHRCLQGPHDLLAAAWRFDPSRWSLHRGSARAPDVSYTLWLGWLDREIANWRRDPTPAIFIHDILHHQNRPHGYQAETRLALWIFARFPRVPWKPSMREALKKDLDNEGALARKLCLCPVDRPRCDTLPCRSSQSWGWLNN